MMTLMNVRYVFTLVSLLVFTACSGSPSMGDPDGGQADAQSPDARSPDACSPSSEEVCGDFLDNTCDGEVDEGCPDPGSHIWANDLGGPLGEDLVTAVVSTADGHAIVLLAHDGEATFGRGQSNETTLPAFHGHQRLMSAARYGASGELIWARRIIASNAIQQSVGSRSLIYTPDNGLLVAGSFRGVATIGPDSESPISFGQANTTSAFLAKFDADGNVVWANEMEGGNTHSMALLPNGKIALAGSSLAGVVFDSNGPNQQVLLPRADFRDLGYVAWFEPSGSFLHAAAITDYLEYPLHVVAGPNNSTELFGAGMVTIDDGTTSITTETAGLYRCVFTSDASIERLDLLVEVANSFQVGEVALGENGDIFITGDMRGSALLAPGMASEVSLDLDTAGTYILHYTSDLQLDWHRVYGGVASGSGYAIVSDPLVPGGAIVAGQLGGVVTIGSGEANEVTLGEPSRRKLYVARFDENGNVRWVRSAKTLGSYNRATTLALLPDHSIVTAGQIGSNTVFGEGQDNVSTLEVQHTAQGFIAVLSL